MNDDLTAEDAGERRGVDARRPDRNSGASLRSSPPSAVNPQAAKRLNQITGQIVDAAFKVHSALGPGLLESVYEACLAHELRSRGLQVSTQVGLPVIYDE